MSALDIEGLDDLDKWVLERIQERTEPDPDSDQVPDCALWTSVHRIRQDTEKFSGWSKDDIERSVHRLKDERKVLFWHGFVTLATEKYLRAVIESERNTSLPRKILIGRVNRYLDDLGIEEGEQA